MIWFDPKVKMLAGSDLSYKQNVSVLVLALVLLSQEVRCNPHECCRQPSRTCRLHPFLCRPHGSADASAGILTLGKRTEIGGAFDSRLQRLLHVSRNHATGLLTVGRRAQAPWDPPSDAAPSPV
ncbi:hypocretin neuropeptide precursor [Stigmatopora argus]